MKRIFGWCVGMMLVSGLVPWVSVAAPVVTAFSPQVGVPGTQVSIQGSGFIEAVLVQFNNEPADFQVLSATSLLATVPSEATVGPIRVSSPGTTGDSGILRFLPAPRLTSISPLRGAAKTTVVLEGQNFEQVSAVHFGEVSTSFIATSSQQIRAVVPTGLTNAVPIRVTTVAGTVVSIEDFTPTGPGPLMDDFEPRFGPPETQVAVYGANFTNVTAVKFGNVAATSFNAPTPDRINTVVPANAVLGANRITVTTGGGSVVSTATFEVTLLPVITGFSPEFGKTGTKVTLEGVNFSGIKNIWFGGVQVSSWGPGTVAGQIVTYVPTGAPLTGKITVENGAGYGQSATDFQVPVAPVILGVDTMEGRPGDNVYITGFNLSGVSLWFNETQANYTVVGASPEAISATVPAGATTGPLRMTNGAGEFVTEEDFFIYGSQPVVKATSPDHGPRGSQVTIEGSNFFAPVIVRFNGIQDETAFAGSASRITATVPAQATTGPVSVTTESGSATNALPFHVPPRFSSFAPRSAPEGQEVTLAGANLAYATRVDFGGVTAAFTAEPDQVIAVVPSGAVNGPIRIETPGGVVLSGSSFTITPAITSVVPVAGPPGSPVTLYGTSFEEGSVVRFRTRLAAVEFVSPQEIQTWVPNAASPGSQPVYVTTSSGTATSSVPFFVTSSTDLRLTGTPSETLLSPGDEVTLHYELVNRGSSPATSVQLEEWVPEGFVHLTSEASQGTWSVTENGVLFEVGLLMNGSTATFSTSAEAVAEGVWTNRVTATLAEGEWDVSNNVLRMGFTVVEPASLVLGIAPSPDKNSVILSWRASGVPLQLQSREGLAGSVPWAPVPDDPSSHGGYLWVTNEPAGASGFYRLILP